MSLCQNLFLNPTQTKRSLNKQKQPLYLYRVEMQQSLSAGL